MPHIATPLRKIARADGTAGFATVDQDSPEDVDQCVFAVVNTPVGHRTDLPEFGRPGGAHRRGGADLAGIERAVALWEPRADLIALRDSGRLAQIAAEAGIDTVKIAGR